MMRDQAVIERVGVQSKSRKRWSVLVYFGLGCLAGCSPAYQMSKMEDNYRDDTLPTSADIPRTANEYLGGILFGSPKKRDTVLLAALQRYGVDSIDAVDLTLQCDNKVRVKQIVDCRDPTGSACSTTTLSKTSTTTTYIPKSELLLTKLSKPAADKCVPISTAQSISGGGGSGASAGMGGAGGGGAGGGGGSGSSPNVPVPVAAIIQAAVDQCIYWTFKEDTTAIGETTWLGVASGGLLAAGLATGAPAAAALGASGAGLSVLTNLGKAVPTSATPSSISSVIQAGLTYYPLIKAKALSGGVSEYKEKVAALAGLWDAAGSGCGTGILKGRSRLVPGVP